MVSPGLWKQRGEMELNESNRIITQEDSGTGAALLSVMVSGAAFVEHAVVAPGQ